MPSLYEAVGYQAMGAINKVTPLDDVTKGNFRPITGDYTQKDYLDKAVDLFRIGNLLELDQNKRENKDKKTINQILYQAALNPCYN